MGKMLPKKSEISFLPKGDAQGGAGRCFLLLTACSPLAERALHGGVSDSEASGVCHRARAGAELVRCKEEAKKAEAEEEAALMQQEEVEGRGGGGKGKAPGPRAAAAASKMSPAWVASSVCRYCKGTMGSAGAGNRHKDCGDGTSFVHFSVRAYLISRICCWRISVYASTR
jgi:hypothetical protein